MFPRVAICMNPAVGDPKAASIFKKHGPWEIDTHVLNLYNLSARQLNKQRYTQELLVDYDI